MYHHNDALDWSSISLTTPLRTITLQAAANEPCLNYVNVRFEIGSFEIRLTARWLCLVSLRQRIRFELWNKESVTSYKN